ncbi:hypothetical protein BJV78DRAFT_170326 [Lactifluus subvellereus]|nr:hypothetical protein BJV78DRAFT_170326 [Lactifluus subvellereus]
MASVESCAEQFARGKLVGCGCVWQALVWEPILKRCPRLRILLVGKSGVGTRKSSLINHAFNVDIATRHRQFHKKEHGVCDINKPIISPQNSPFLLHDSQGFEPSEIAPTWIK